MSNSFLPKAEDKLVQWANNFVSYAVTRPVQTGLSTTAVTEITNRRNDFQNSILLTETAESAFRANVKLKATKMKNLEDYARSLNLIIQGNLNVTDETKLGLGLAIKKKRERRLPEIPADLTVKATKRGDNLLKWKANGNRIGAMCEVWACYGASKEWKYVESVTGITFTDKTAPAYEKVTYKVRAKVDGKFSKFSNEAALTTPAATPILMMDKAA